MSWIKILTRWFVYFSYLTLVVIILIEIIFQILPVSDSLKVQEVNKNDPIMHFEENRVVNKQIGFNFKKEIQKKINNYGFATDVVFLSKELKNKKTVVIIGDSYVEAINVKNKDTFHGLLDKSFKDINFYPIGTSGSPLSQYIAYMTFSKKEFDPDVYIFVVISNDFDESWFEIKKTEGFHYFNDQGDLELIEYEPRFLVKLLRQSAFVRYLILDLKIINQFRKYTKIKKKTNSNLIEKKDLNEELGIKAARLFLEKINEYSNDKEIVILVDGDRTSIYNNQVDRNLNYIANRWLKKITELTKDYPNFHLIDLQKVFLNNWQKNNLKFNSDNDYHWNEFGNKVVAESLKSKLISIIESNSN